MKRKKYWRSKNAYKAYRRFALIILFFHRMQIFLPFDREEILLLGIAFFAGGNHVSLRAPPSPTERNEMVHRQLGGLELPAAVIADAGAAAALPPLAIPQLARFRLLAFDVVVIDVDIKRLYHLLYSITAVTGAWSDGRSSARGPLSISQPRQRAAIGGVAQM